MESIMFGFHFVFGWVGGGDAKMLCIQSMICANFSPEVLGCELPMSNSDETLFFHGKNTHIANHPFDGTPCLSLESPREAACFLCQKKNHSLHMKNGPRWFASNRRPKLLLAVRNLPHFIMITSHIHPLSLDGCFSFEETTGCQMRASGGGGEEGGWDEF